MGKALIFLFEIFKTKLKITCLTYFELNKPICWKYNSPWKEKKIFFNKVVLDQFRLRNF